MTPIRERLARTPPGYRYSIGRILAIYSGLMVALLLAALDQTIVATALPRVVSELGGITQYAWVFTAYMLGSTVTVPLYGRLGDVYGRKPLFIVAISIFIAGSALCGASQNMVQLVVFRAIQGVGAGGIFPLTLAMVGMIVPPRDRGRYQGLIGSVFAAASIIGPLIGGFIVDNASWRWIFYVNLPVGGVALTVILITMPKRRTKQEHYIDWLGAGILALGTSSLLLGLVWGGRDYPWLSAHVLGALAASVVLLTLFGLWERRVPEPIIPFHLLRNQTVAASVACMAFVGMAMFGTISYVPLFVQGVIGTSATSSGVVLTPLLLGAVTTSFVSGQIVSAHRPLPAEHAARAAHPRGGRAPALAAERGLDERAGGEGHGDRRDRARADDADLRALGAELGLARGDGDGDGADPVLALDRGDPRRDADGRDREPGPASERARARHRRSTGCRPRAAKRSRTRCTRPSCLRRESAASSS